MAALASSLEDASRLSQLESELESVKEGVGRDEEDLQEATIAQQCLEARNEQLDMELQAAEAELFDFRPGGPRQSGSFSSQGSRGALDASASMCLAAQQAEVEKLQRRNDLLLDALHATTQSPQARDELGRHVDVAARGASCSAELRTVLAATQDLRRELAQLQELEFEDAEETEQRVTLLQAGLQDAEMQGAEQQRLARRELSELLAGNEALETELQVLQHAAADGAAGWQEVESLRSELAAARALSAAASADASADPTGAGVVAAMDGMSRSQMSPMGTAAEAVEARAERSNSPEPSPRDVETGSLLDELGTTISSISSTAAPRGLLTLDDDLDTSTPGLGVNGEELAPRAARRLSQKALTRRDKHQRARMSIAGFAPAASSSRMGLSPGRAQSLQEADRLQQGPQDDRSSQPGSSTLSVIDEYSAALGSAVFNAPQPAGGSARSARSAQSSGEQRFLRVLEPQDLRWTTEKGAVLSPGTIWSIATSSGLSEGDSDSGESRSSDHPGESAKVAEVAEVAESIARPEVRKVQAAGGFLW